MATATSPVLVQGQYLWKDGERFLVRGVVYQATDSNDYSLGGRDLISDDRLAQLRHDVGLFRELDINTICIYAIDTAKSHVEAMKMLEEAGIYVIISLSSPTYCINRTDPYASYNFDTLTAYFKRVDVMASFSNTLGVLVADHLINNTKSESCTPVIRAVVRDLKKHMRLGHGAGGHRVLPIGFGGGQYEGDRKILNYLTTGDENSCVDFWTCTGFKWTGKSDTDLTGYDHLIERYKGISVPIIMTEYGFGITTKTPRKFNETTTLYSPKATEVFSGGCAYEFWQGPNAYGLAMMKRKIPYKALDRAKPGTIAEERESDLGALMLFEDFFNYKEKLASVANGPTSTVEGRMAGLEVEESHGLSRGDTEIEGTVPESCVDWVVIEEELRSGVQSA